ncbi:cathepsin G-like isoform X3 [Myotis daubentonii]|uniref:cathepsin G-like isoform X3 n=1 Tax=Myotis daubentonii TaxID=98922 RepID=UPI002873B4B1|nr:cathepsin G-like isoform X3 [Myotis daubentonii]
MCTLLLSVWLQFGFKVRCQMIISVYSIRAQRTTSSSDLSSLPGKMQPPLLVLLLAFFLLPSAEAGEIIGGHEARPHSRPYMAYLRIKDKKEFLCGGVLVQKNYVLTAAHCKGRSISVKLGAHNIKEKEKTQQDILVKRAIPHPKFNKRKGTYDIMLLQGDSGGPLLCRNGIQGIVSYGSDDGTPPRVFTKVASFLPWIKETMESLQLQEPDHLLWS